jgi:uncharacterized protein YbaP (TraB family)
MHSTILRALLPALMALPFAAVADQGAPAQVPAEMATLDTVVVSGEQPGPGLWKVSKDGHVLWILGTLTPLPKKMVWVSSEIEATIAQSQEVLLAPTASFDIKGGAVRGLFLLPSLLGARNNPDKAKLVDVVPADLYARWATLKEKYIGRDNGIEKRRPIFAAHELYAKAIERSGLSSDDVVTAVVKKTAKKNDIALTEPKLALRIEEPKAAIREFAQSPLDDIDCFSKTLTRLEFDIEAMKARGNAWATGDIEAMQALPYTDQNQACSDAILHASVTQERGLGDIRTRMTKLWLDAAEAALKKNTTSFAVLQIRHIFDSEGIVATLKAQGYTVQAPWEQEPE